MLEFSGHQPVHGGRTQIFVRRVSTLVPTAMAGAASVVSSSAAGRAAGLPLPESMARILAMVREGICSHRHCHNSIYSAYLLLPSLGAEPSSARLPGLVQASTSSNEDMQLEGLATVQQ